MTLRYAKIDSITKRLAGRITVTSVYSTGLTGVTQTEIGLDLIDISGQAQEEFVDLFLGMVYELPLQQEHAFVQSIVEKLIVSDVLLTYFPATSELPDNSDNFALVMRQQALNDLQCLFNGLGIFVPGANQELASIQNDPTQPQLVNKALILKGERLKPFIGYDLNGDNVSDTDIFKMNTNQSPSFYTVGDWESLYENATVINGVKVRPSRHSSSWVEVNFID